MTKSNNLQAATAYANRGWSVIPITHGTKKARISWKSAQASRASIELIKHWWGGKRGRDGVGIVTGQISNLIVIDIDRPGDAIFDIEENGGLPQTPCVRTAKGVHHYFLHPGNGTSYNGPLPWGDLKGDGGYVLAPPSIHPETKKPYLWEVSPRDCPIASLPEWILTLLKNSQHLDGEIPSLSPPVEGLIPGGRRNQTLTSVAGTMRRRGMSWDEIFPSLMVVNLSRCQPPLPEGEVREIAQNIERYAPEINLFEIPDISAEDALYLNSLHCTDSGNGEAIAHLYGDLLRFNHSAQKWLLWDGVRWAEDRDNATEMTAALVARQRLAAAARCQSEETRKKLVKWSISSENRNKVQSALFMAATDRSIAVTSEKFDVDPWILGCQNGILDLRTGELCQGTPERMITLSTLTPYQSTAQAPRWMQFLDEIFQGDSELISFIRRSIGYTLTGNTREQCLFLCWGPGNNGKSVFLNVLHEIMGEYAHNADFATFLEGKPRSGSTATPDLVALHGSRLVTASEVKEDRRLNEARIKSLTGGDPVTGRPLYGRPFTFVPAFKLWLAVNHKPRIKETGLAIWRRVRLIPFKAHFPPGKGDPDLIHELKAEAPGILAWAVAGCLAWQSTRLNPPLVVTKATSEYRADQDLLQRFLSTQCTRNEGAQVKASTLYKSYRRWCEDEGERALSSTAFGSRITDLFHKSRGMHGNVYHGLCMADVMSPPEGALI